MKPDTCVDIQNNIDGKKKFGKRISVFPLVDNSPTKQDGDKLEELITEANNDDIQSSPEVESKEESYDEDEFQSSPESKLGTDLQSSFTSPAGNCQSDLDISSESDSDEESEAAAIEVDDNLKRKAKESPESKDGFQTVPGKKGKNIKKNKLN